MSLRRAASYVAQDVGVSVPLAGTWDYGWWDYRDVIAQADNTPLATPWEAREGAVPLGIGVGTPPLFRAAPHFAGRQCVSFTGVADGQLAADALAPALSGMNVPITRVVVGRFTALPAAGEAMITLTDNAATPFDYFLKNSSGNLVRQRHDAAGSPALTQQPILNGLGMFVDSWDGADGQFWFDNYSPAAASYALASLSPLTFTRVRVGLIARTGNSASASMDVLYIGMRSGKLTQQDVEYIYNFCAYDGDQTPLAGWFLGDSITNGFGDSDALGGMRGRLWNQLVAINNYRLELVGTTGSVQTWQWAHIRHDGLSGRTIAQVQAKLEQAAGGPDVGNPRFLFLLTGTNDCVQNNGLDYDPVATPAQYAACLEKARELLPGSTQIAVSTIPDVDPAYAGGLGTANAADYNSKLPAVWAAFESSYPGVLIQWDGRASLGAWNAATYVDEFHPNAAGYDLLCNDGANGLLQAIQPHLVTVF